MIILGIDPGLSATGYGVVERRGSRVRLLGFGEISTSPRDPLSVRIDKIYSEVGELIDRYHPDLMVLEELFFNTNARSAMAVGQARGGILLASAHHGVGVEEYTPLQVKQSLVGHGRADKKQVKYMVRAILSMTEEIGSSHASDALALAICHAHHVKMRDSLAQAAPGAGSGARGLAGKDAPAKAAGGKRTAK